jgi:hypothetical protein
MLMKQMLMRRCKEKMVREGYAKVMHIPPSEFDSYEWKA